jgi:hypothetical protein
MSCWLVSNAHIDILVNAACEYGVMTCLNRKHLIALGQDLWTENNRSVNYRYGKRSKSPRYTLHTIEASLDPVGVLKALSYYCYQSDERPGWGSSRAREFVEGLKDAVLSAHPELTGEVADPYDIGGRHTVPVYRQTAAWDAAPWGFESLEQAQAARV